MKRFFQFCFSFAGIFLLAIFVTSCADHYEQFNEEPEQDTLLVFEVESIDSVFYHNKLKYEIRAAIEEDSIKFRDSIYIPGFRKYLQRRDTLTIKKYPQGVTLTISGDSLKDTLVLKAKKAVYRSVERTFEFIGNVEFSSIKFTLFTDHLMWKQGMKLYETEKIIRINTPTAILNGEGFWSNETFTECKVLKITGTFMHQ